MLFLRVHGARLSTGSSAICGWKSVRPTSIERGNYTKTHQLGKTKPLAMISSLQGTYKEPLQTIADLAANSKHGHHMSASGVTHFQLSKQRLRPLSPPPICALFLPKHISSSRSFRFMLSIGEDMSASLPSNFLETIQCPKKHRKFSWSRSNMKRMSSFLVLASQAKNRSRQVVRAAAKGAMNATQKSGAGKRSKWIKNVFKPVKTQERTISN